MSVSGHICNGLFSISEDSFRTEECIDFAGYLEDIKTLKETIVNSEIIHVLQSHNLKMDSLVRSARNKCLLSFTWMQNYQFGLQSQLNLSTLLTK